MTDLLDISSGRIVIRDVDGAVSFDTDERPFLPLASLSGSISFPERIASSNASGIQTYYDVTAGPYYLGACPSACNVVRGSFFVSSAGYNGVANIGWFNAGGTYFHYMAEGSTAVAYTFYASGGGVYVEERAVVIAQVPTSGTRQVTVFSTTFNYKLIAGVFL